MTIVQKKDRENFEHLLRRFNRQVQQSGLLSLAKKKVRFEKKTTKRAVRDAAQRVAWREEFKKKKMMSRIK